MSDPVLVLREALAKATEGPWFRDYDSVVTRGSDEEDDWPGRWTVAKTGPGTTVSRDPKHLADAQFILAARNLLPVLLDEVEALRTKNKNLNEIYERHTVALQEERDDAKDEVEALRKVVQDVRAAAEGWRPFWGGCCGVHSAATDAYNEAADEVRRLLAVLDKEEEK